LGGEPETAHHVDDALMTQASQDALTKRIQELEQQLDEMTAALTQAWDQLVPLLEARPQQAESSEDIVPTLEGIMSSVEAQMGMIYLMPREGKPEEWFLLPHDPIAAHELRRKLVKLHEQRQTFVITDVPIWNGELYQWVCMPMIVDHDVVGVIGVGVHDAQRTFTALDARVLARMTENAASQIIAASLKRSREREEQVKREIEIAGQIQRSIQPDTNPIIRGLEVAGYWQPTSTVGGDAWGWVIQPSGHLAGFLLDVSGKGLPAALAAVSLHTAIRMALRLGLSPVDVLSKVNDEFYDSYTRAGIIATASVIRVDPQSNRVEQANAGHTPTLIYHRGRWKRWRATVPPLGVLAELRPVAQRMTFEAGDLLVVYSDGFTEIETVDGLWGEAGLLAAMPTNVVDAAQVVEAIVPAAEQVRGGRPVHDDQTMLVVHCAAYVEVTRLAIPAAFGALETVTRLIHAVLQGHRMELRDRVALAVHELCVNIVHHAYAGSKGTIDLEVRHGKNILEIILHDTASNRYQRPDKIVMPNPDDMPQGGWGMSILHQVMDDVRYEGLSTGNRWHLVKRI
jgi:sigma-B regulation protein RsbU (phosphoserine phosphatase)